MITFSLTLLLYLPKLLYAWLWLQIVQDYHSLNSDVVKASALGWGESSCFDQLFLLFWLSIRNVSRKCCRRGERGGQKIFRTNISKSSNSFDQNKHALQFFQRKHDQSLEIVKITNDFITLTIFYLKLWTTLTNVLNYCGVLPPPPPHTHTR
jgi:hypothetical protein